MEAKQIDPTEFREGQRQQWNKAASAWKEHSEFIDKEATPVSERLVELAGVQPGSRVLDVACGYGEPSLTAARAAGDDGTVVATDISAEMLAYGRERAEAAGVGNIEFVEGAGHSLEFDEDSFDAAVSRWGIIFDPDGEGTAGLVRGFLKPGGRFAISSWGPPDRAPFLGIPVMTLIQQFGIQPPPPGTPGPLSRPTPEAIGGLLEGGGFSDVAVEDTEIGFTWESAEQFTSFVGEIAPPITAMMKPLDDETKDRAWQAITDAAAEHADDDGTVTLRNQVLLAVGTA